jgi:hypothetical protein
MARFDKYDPVAGGFRGNLAAAYTGSPNMVGVGLDVNGRIVPGAGISGILGVICQPNNRAANERIDVMDRGEILDVTGLTPGTVYTANTTTGAITSAAGSATQTPVGVAIEATRFIVKVNTPVFIGT